MLPLVALILCLCVFVFVCVFAAHVETPFLLLVSLHDSLNSTDRAPVPALCSDVAENTEYTDSKTAQAARPSTTGLFTFLLGRKHVLLL